MWAEETQRHRADTLQSGFIRNVSWTTLSTLIRVIVAGGTLAVISRMVDPATMGLYGVGWSAAMLGYTVSQNGAAQAIIGLPILDKKHIAAAQVLSFFIALVIGTLIVIAAPLAQRIYAHPGISFAVSLGGLFVPLMNMGAVDVAVSQKGLEFSRLAAVQTGSVILASLASIMLAVFGHGLVALYALQGLVGPFNFLLFRLYRRPTGFGKTTFSHISDVWKIGMHLSLGSLTGALWQSAPQLVMARLVSIDVLGMFVFCMRIVQIVFSQLNGMVNAVVYPTFARLAKDPTAVGRAYLEIVRFTFVSMIMPLISIGVAPASFLAIYGGRQWTSASETLFYLVLMQIVICIGSNVFPTFAALGRPSVVWRWNLFITAVQVIGMLATSQFGYLAIVKSLALTACVMPLAVFWLSRTTGFRFTDYWRNILPVMAPAVPAMVLGALIQRVSVGSPPVFVLCLSAGIAVVTYGVCVVTFDQKMRATFMLLMNRLRMIGGR